MANGSLNRKNRNQYGSFADNKMQLGGAGGPLNAPPAAGRAPTENWYGKLKDTGALPGIPAQSNLPAKPTENWYEELKNTGTLPGLEPPKTVPGPINYATGTPMPRPFPQSAWGSRPSYTAPAWTGSTPTPTYGTSPAPTPPESPTIDWGQLAPTNWEQWIGQDADWQTGAGNYFATQLPIQQFLQNNMQYGNDFTESMRRWNEQMQWQQALDSYNAMLAGRQQQLAEGQTEAAANQWAQQFQYQQGLDQRSMDLERELQSLNAFGRSVTPGARFVRNWG